MERTDGKNSKLIQFSNRVKPAWLHGFWWTKRTAPRRISSAAPSTTRTTLHIYFFWHRLARPSDECEISVQEQRFSGGVQDPAKPAAKGFAADKPASGSRPFECCTIDHSDNSPSISTGYPDDFVIQKSMPLFGRNLLGMWRK